MFQWCPWTFNVIYLYPPNNAHWGCFQFKHNWHMCINSHHLLELFLNCGSFVFVYLYSTVYVLANYIAFHVRPRSPFFNCVQCTGLHAYSLFTWWLIYVFMSNIIEDEFAIHLIHIHAYAVTLNIIVAFEWHPKHEPAKQYRKSHIYRLTRHGN